MTVETRPSSASDYPEPVGASSRPIRFLIASVVVALYMSLGFWLHPGVAEYSLLGVPILLAFQWGIQRRPIRTLWVQSGPALRLDSQFYLIWAVFSIVPIYDSWQALQNGAVWNAVMGLAAVAGAFGLAYALQSARAATAKQTVLCLLTAGLIGALPVLMGLVLPHIVHFRVNGQITTSALLPWPSILLLGGRQFLLGPVGFVVEEAFFRGGLDTYVHRGEEGVGWLSAILISGLWGLWHLPGQTIPQGHLASTVVALLAAQIAVGVPLSLWWRKSGNLVVTDTTHAFLDTLRSVLTAAA